MWNFIKNNRWAGYFALGISCLIIGIAIAYFTMQTTIKTKDTTIEKLTTTNAELTASKETLTTQNTKLQQQINQQQNQHLDTITYPDGTVHTVIDTSTNTQTVTNLTNSIETKIKEQYEQKFEQWVSEYEKTHLQEITNPKTISILALGGFGANTFTFDAILKAKVWGPLGVAGGFGMSWNRTPLIVNTNWSKPDLIGKGGVSLDL